MFSQNHRRFQLKKMRRDFVFVKNFFQTFDEFRFVPRAASGVNYNFDRRLQS
jgi:hypothetical protein